VPKNTRDTPTRILFACLITASAYPARLAAQSEPPVPWSFRTRIVMSGNSDQSEPAGYTVYSGIGIEAALARSIGRRFSAELAIRTESREVDRDLTATSYDRLGALELLPVNLTLHWRPRSGRSFDPYLGAGLNLTVAWEMSGALDTLDMAPHVGPALQVGTDIALSRTAFLNLDLRWNTLTTELSHAGTTVARLVVDPVALGVGVGFRF
jgi:outer membrane protein